MNGFARQIAVLAGALVLFVAAPALASAAQSFKVTSSTGFPAGGDPSYTQTQVLDTSHGSPGAVRITSAPGVLASLAANPTCIKTLQYTSACMIGSGSAGPAPGVGASLTAYLVPPPNPRTDAAGIDLMTGAPGQAPTHVAVQLVQTPSGNVQSVLNFSLAGLGPLAGALSNMSTTVNGTLGGKPFTRMPSNCNVTTHSTMTVTYADGTTETSTASPDFAPTGCSSLPFNPQVTGSLVKDAHDNGVAVVTNQTQGLGEAAGLSTTLELPWPAVIANTAALPLQNTSTPIGTAVATSPLQPAPLTGFAYLTGPSPFTATLTLKFPPPVALTLVGNVDLNAHTVTFPALPDVPQTGLVVTLFGGPKAAEAATCAPPGGILRASNTGQNGKVVTESFPISVQGCPTVPKLSGASFAGLANRKPALRFKVTRGTDAPNLRSIAVSLPRGLTFKKSKRPGNGISVSGGHSVRLSGGKLIISLKPAAASVSVRIASSALVESKQLQQQVRIHKDNPTKQLRLTVTDADGASSTLTG
ncbi:MAG TPA: hypothetical protein VGH24_11300 [Solirubrobacteraceae bacterium]